MSAVTAIVLYLLGLGMFGALATWLARRDDQDPSSAAIAPPPPTPQPTPLTNERGLPLPSPTAAAAIPTAAALASTPSTPPPPVETEPPELSAAPSAPEELPSHDVVPELLASPAVEVADVPPELLVPPLEDESVPPTTPPIEETEAPVVGASQHQGIGDTDLAAAIARLGNSGQIQHALYVSRYMNHPDRQVRVAVAQALGAIAARNGKFAGERLVPALGKLSKDSAQPVRVAAVEALGRVPSKAVLPWLGQALRHPDTKVQHAAGRAIRGLKFDYGERLKVSPRASNGYRPRR